MAKKLDPKQLITFEELLRAMMFETEATRRVLLRKGLLTNQEVLQEVKAVRREMIQNFPPRLTMATQNTMPKKIPTAIL